MDKRKIDEIIEYIFIAGKGNIIRPQKHGFCELPLDEDVAKAIKALEENIDISLERKKGFGIPERKGFGMPERKSYHKTEQAMKTAEEITRNKNQSKIPVIEILRKNIFRNVADLNDYNAYFNTLKECSLTDDKEIASIFNDSGFDGVEDYYNQRLEYLKSFSLLNVDWDARHRFEREVMVKIICLSNRTSRLESWKEPELSIK